MTQVLAALPPFTIDTFNALFDQESAEANVEATIEVAAASPTALYYFMQRYAHFNGYAGSLVARLASAIGISRDMFNQADVLVADLADRGLDIAAKVLAATIDEHADSAQKVTHRKLAQVTVTAIGDYAGLSDGERDRIAQVPDWLKPILTETVNGYQGEIGNVQALVTAVGFHIASETLADREYALIDKVIRHYHRGEGFDAYLQGKQVEVAGKRLSPWYWIVVHGKHNDTGVEAEHSELAVEALNLIVKYRPESAETILEWASAGFLKFVELQQKFFCESEIEMQTVTTRNSLKQAGIITAPFVASERLVANSLN